jgi:hypothetical protein
MPTELLPIGPVVALVQNQVYALPAVQCRLYTDNAATLLQSTTQAFTASTAVTLVEGGYLVTGGFIKLTSAGPANVILKRA